MKTCPACAGTLRDEALKCPHCKAVLDRAAVRRLQGAPPPRRYRRRGVWIGLVALPALLLFSGILLRMWWEGARRVNQDTYAFLDRPAGDPEPQPVKYIKFEAEGPALLPAARGVADFIGWEKEAPHYVRVLVRADGTVRIQLSYAGFEAYGKDPLPLRAHFRRIAEHVYTRVLAEDRDRKVLLTDNRDEEVCEEAAWREGAVLLAPK